MYTEDSIDSLEYSIVKMQMQGWSLSQRRSQLGWYYSLSNNKGESIHIDAGLSTANFTGKEFCSELLEGIVVTSNVSAYDLVLEALMLLHCRYQRKFSESLEEKAQMYMRGRQPLSYMREFYRDMCAKFH